MRVTRLSPARFFGLCCCLLAGVVGAETSTLRVAVLDDAPPLAYRDAAGNLTGFSYAIAQALCGEIGMQCEFEASKLDYLVDDLASGHFDMVAVGLLNTPDRRQKVVFTQPVYRSVTMWFARPGIKPGQPGVRVSVFKGSAQELYAKAHGWETIGAQTDVQMIDQLAAGVVQGVMAPLMTSLNLQKSPKFLRLGLESTTVQTPELDGNACFALNQRRADLKGRLDEALEKIKRNGVYDRINSQYLPFRVL